MKRGQEVYFISKGVVRKGIIEDQDSNSVRILCKRFNEKRYTFKKNEIAVEIERGTDGVQGSSKSSSVESNKRCDKKNGCVCKPRVSIGNGQNESNKVFVGAWRIRNMA